MAQRANIELVNNLKPFIAKVTQQQISSIPTTSDADTNPSTIIAGDANGRVRFDGIGINTPTTAAGIDIAASIRYVGDGTITTDAGSSITLSPAVDLTLNPTGDLRVDANVIFENAASYSISTTGPTGDIVLSPAEDLELTPGGDVRIDADVYFVGAQSISTTAGDLTLSSFTGIIDVNADIEFQGNQAITTDAGSSITLSPAVDLTLNPTGDLRIDASVIFENAASYTISTTGPTGDIVLAPAEDLELTPGGDVRVDANVLFVGAQSISTTAGDLTLSSFTGIIDVDADIEFQGNQSITTNAGSNITVNPVVDLTLNPGGDVRIDANVIFENAASYSISTTGPTGDIVLAPAEDLELTPGGDVRIDADFVFVGAQRIETTAGDLTLAPAVNVNIDADVEFQGFQTITSTTALDISATTNLSLVPTDLYLRPTNNNIYVDNTIVFDAAGTISTSSSTLTLTAVGDIYLTPGGNDVQVDGDIRFNGAQNIETSSGNLSILPAGDLIINPTGGDTTLTGDLSVSADAVVGSGLSVGDITATPQNGQLLLNQALRNDQIIQLISTGDVTHGMTSITPTDVYGYFTKVGDLAGGMQVTGATEQKAALVLSGLATNEATGTNSTSSGVIQAKAWLRSETSITTLSASANLFSVWNGSAAVMHVKGDGDLYLDGVVGTAFDDKIDVELLRAAGLQFKGAIRGAFDDMIQYNRKDLEDLNLINETFMNVSNFIRLLVGNAWQQEIRMRKLEEVAYGTNYN